jgi:hypothetical protein
MEHLVKQILVAAVAAATGKQVAQVTVALE